MAAVDMGQARPYLDALFGNAAAGEFLLIWTLPDRRSAWFTDVDSACLALVSPQYEGKDVYAGACTSPFDMGPSRRCDAANVASMGCLWADIDIGREGHKKENYPKTLEDAMTVLSAYPKPSMVVSTGHGIHAYWLFRERFPASRPVDNEAAKELIERWQRWLLRGMEEHGLTMDMTWDLARVLRVPGATNHKDKAHVLPVTLVENNGTQYDWLDLSKMIPSDIHAAARTTATKSGSIGALKLSEDRVLNGDVLNALQLRFRAKFNDSFQRTKPLSGGDQSASGYDASLAMYGVIGNLDDQQIADLIIMSRRAAGQDLKLRQDYYANTISSARREAKKADSIEELINQSKSTPESQEALNISPEEARARVLDSLSTVLGVHVDRIVKYDLDPDPIFWIEINGSRRVKIGPVDVIMEEKKFKNKVMATVGALLPDFKRPEWEKIAQLIVTSAEVQDNLTDGLFEDSTKALISEYLLATKIGDEPSDAAVLGMPFINSEGRVAIFLQSLKQWIYYTRHKDIREQDLAQFLTNIGCMNRRMHFVMKSSGKSMTPHVWIVPPDLVPGNDK
jgi:hypothetical protein